MVARMSTTAGSTFRFLGGPGGPPFFSCAERVKDSINARDTTSKRIGRIIHNAAAASMPFCRCRPFLMFAGRCLQPPCDHLAESQSAVFSKHLCELLFRHFEHGGTFRIIVIAA